MGRLSKQELEAARSGIGEFDEAPRQALRVSSDATQGAVPSLLSDGGLGHVLPVVEGEDLDTIRRVWGETLLEEPAKVQAILYARSVLAEESARMLRSAVSAGRALRAMSDVLSREELDRGLRGHREAFPGWAPSTLSKLISIAKFVDETRLAIELLPQSWTVLYEFTTLADDELRRAKSVKLLRPDVTRADILRYKRNLRGSSAGGAAPSAAAKSELERLDKQIVALQAELAATRRKRKELAGAFALR